MFNKILILFVLLFSLIQTRNVLAHSNTRYHQYYLESKNIYNTILNSWNDGSALKDINNIAGGIVWGEAYILESLLEMYEATKDTSYLAIFIEHANAVYNNRDDKAGIKDHLGNVGIGWLTGGQFTLGKPIIVLDDIQLPSLKLQAVRYGNNNRTSFSIDNNLDDKSFSIEVWNDKIGAKRVYSELTMQNIEEKINKNLSPSSLLMVRSLGKNIPTKVISRRFKTFKTRLKSFHNPIICTPYVRFAVLVDKYHLGKYKDKAKLYSQFAEECAESYLYLWKDELTTGYFLVEDNKYFWMSNLPVPHNILSANGTFFLYLYLATGKGIYKNIFEKIGSKIRLSITKNSSGKITQNYAYGKLYNGWEDWSESIYKNYIGSKHIEDNPHFSHTMRFIWEAQKHFNLFDKTVLHSLTAIFNSSYSMESLSHKVDGTGVKSFSNEAAGAFSLLGIMDHSIVDKCFLIYKKNYVDSQKGVVLLGWARLANMSKQINDDLSTNE